MAVMLSSLCTGMLLYLAIASLAEESKTAKSSGNGCPESQPWPCKTPGQCLSFDFICDGEPDCPDKYDEDQSLCTAKNRPPFEVLDKFLLKYESWLIPKYLGQGTHTQIATYLIESTNAEEYSNKMKLTQQQKKDLMDLLTAVKEGRQIELIMEGMPPRAWNELYLLFGRIASSGFLK